MLTEELKCCPVSSAIKDFVSNEGDGCGQLMLGAKGLMYRLPQVNESQNCPAFLDHIKILYFITEI